MPYVPQTWADNPAGGTPITAAQLNRIEAGVVAALPIDTLVYNVRDHGVKGDGKTVLDGAMTSGSAVLTSATAVFTAADVGKRIMVSNASSTAMRLAGRVAGFGSSTSITLSKAAATAGTGRTLTVDGIRTVADAVTTANSTTVTSATAAFTTNDVGKAIWIEAVDTVALNATISGYTNSTTVTLAASATRTCSGVQVVYGTDDTTAIRAAIAYANAAPSCCTLYFPGGMYLATPSHLDTNPMEFGSNTHILGDGWKTIIRSTGNEDALNRSWELWGINTGTSGSSDPATNVTNVIFENLHFQGTTVEEGFLENGSNLLSLNACSDVIVRGCKFSNSRSDGLYIGSGTVGGSNERHNERIRVEDCTFDGINNQNRNGITLVDGTDVTIDHCAFMNFATDNMPGAIDCEPNDFGYTRLRGIQVTHCSFTMIGGNQGVFATYLNTPIENFTIPPQGLLFSDNYIYNCMSSTIGFVMFAASFPLDTSSRQHVQVLNNVFRGNPVDGTGIAYCFDIEGIRGVRIAGNVFDATQHSGMLGYTYKVADIDIVGNTFKDVSGAGGKALEIVRADRVVIDGNTFDHVSPLAGGGYVTRQLNGGTLSTPASLTLTPSTTGGTLTAGTRAYRVSAYMDDTSETVACAEVTAATTGTTASVALSWFKVYGAKGYKVYGRAVGAELLMSTQVGVNSNTFTDTGSVTPAGALPTGTSANGHSNGVTFINNIVRQGSSNNTSAIGNVVAGHVATPNSNFYWNNQLPQNAALAMGPYVDSTAVYTAAAAATTIDASLVPSSGQIVINTSATAITTLTVANPVIGQQLTVRFVLTVGTQAYVWAANMKFAGAAAPTKSTTTGRSDSVTFVYDGTNWVEIYRAINVG